MTDTKKMFLRGCLTGGVLTIVLLAAGFLGGVFIFKEAYVAYKAKHLSAPLVPYGKKADFGWAVEDIDGKTVDMARFRGKPLFLCFWHPECTTCLSEIGALNTLCAKMGKTEFAFAFVTWCSAEELREAVKSRHIQFPVYRLPGARPKVFQASGTPSAYVVAANGDIVFEHVGGAKWDDETVVNFLARFSEPLKAEVDTTQP